MPAKKLNKKTRDDIENRWYNTIPERLKDWLKGLPSPLNHQLDFSPDSIEPLQNYLWERYDSSSIESEENMAEIECIAYYYGEIHRKHMPIKMEWVSSNILNEGSISSMFLSNDEYLNTGTSIFDNIVASVAETEKGESHLIWFYNKKLEVQNKTIENKEFNFIFSIRLDDNYQYFLLQKTDTNPLLQIKILLEDNFSKRDNPPKLSYYRDNNDYLIIEMSDDYCFHFKFKSGDWTKESIELMSKEKYTGELDKSDIAQCRSTTEFWGDQDNNMDYMNEALWLLEYIAPKLPDLVTIYDLKNGDEIRP